MSILGEVKMAPQDTKPRLLLIAGAVLLIFLAGLAGVFFWKYKHAQGNSGVNKSKHVIAEVGGVYILPKGETPTVAAIQDKSKLAGQTFFDDAQNGDYVLIYTKAKLALLYRESLHKLVNVGPVNTGPDTPGAQAGGQR